MASWPKSAPEPLLSESRVYASSMNSTPPSARSKTAVVLMAVPPMTWATRSARDTSTMCPVGSMPSSARMFPYSRATVVLPVPGGPAKTRCRLIGGAGMPSWARRWVSLPRLTRVLTCA